MHWRKRPQRSGSTCARGARTPRPRRRRRRWWQTAMGRRLGCGRQGRRNATKKPTVDAVVQRGGGRARHPVIHVGAASRARSDDIFRSCVSHAEASEVRDRSPSAAGPGSATPRIPRPCELVRVGPGQSRVVPEGWKSAGARARRAARATRAAHAVQHVRPAPRRGRGPARRGARLEVRLVRESDVTQNAAEGPTGQRRCPSGSPSRSAAPARAPRAGAARGARARTRTWPRARRRAGPGGPQAVDRCGQRAARCPSRPTRRATRSGAGGSVRAAPGRPPVALRLVRRPRGRRSRRGPGPGPVAAAAAAAGAGPRVLGFVF